MMRRIWRKLNMRKEFIVETVTVVAMGVLTIASLGIGFYQNYYKPHKRSELDTTIRIIDNMSYREKILLMESIVDYVAQANGDIIYFMSRWEACDKITVFYTLFNLYTDAVAEYQLRNKSKFMMEKCFSRMLLDLMETYPI